MSQMTAIYKGDLRTEGVHLKSGNKIITDAPLDNNGKGEAYSPTDLVCAALASCILTTLGILANRENLDITDMKAEITKVMATDPRRIAEIAIDITLPENKISKLSDKHKLTLKRAAHSCPVAISLHPDLKQVLNFNF
jgi:putative redox protein